MRSRTPRNGLGSRTVQNQLGVNVDQAQSMLIVDFADISDDVSVDHLTDLQGRALTIPRQRSVAGDSGGGGRTGRARRCAPVGGGRSAGDGRRWPGVASKV